MANGESFIYELKKPFKYSNKGQEEEALTIAVECPSSNILRQHLFIKSELLSCLGKAQKASADADVDIEKLKEELGKNGEKQKFSANEMLMLFGTYGDIYKCCNELKDILSKTGNVNGGSQKVTSPIWADFSVDDIEQLLGEYVVNFIAGSILH